MSRQPTGCCRIVWSSAAVFIMRNGDSNHATFITCPPCMAYAEFLLAVTVTVTVTGTVTVTVTGTVTGTGTVTVLLGWLDIDVKTAHGYLP